ncbi:MAG: hypothetical protein CFE23_05460 [Flavobacterium sp. BFFFF1]|uniref:DUF1579 domain-containing protein n=1 Tax=Flavobacterium sp. BFFFF1 TaxID=2015557 RepID=UPI000BC4BFF5|nr:DUF1579 domain-containing protein [Flavobacterium sp. BFFFF1]OYU81214.1 MAG: hypothetical protein CFE23_05460 [Flavobacterium sp. BFFFF1]
MKKSCTYLAALLITVTACKKEDVKNESATTDSTTVATEKTATEPAKPMDSVAMMEAWKAYATPGDMQKLLAEESGNWSGESKMWMDPTKAPEVTTMKGELKMVLGGRYQEGKYTGTAMGAPFEGKGLVAYNNATGKFEQTWTDNMGTGIMFMTGTYDSAAKTITYSGECVDPATKQPKKIKQIYQIVDANTRKLEGFDTGPDGKEYKTMEITMLRK